MLVKLANELARRRVTQTEAARLMDVHPTRLNRWLAGAEPDPPAYDKLVKFLSLDGLDALGGLILRQRIAQYDARPTRRR